MQRSLGEEIELATHVPTMLVCAAMESERCCDFVALVPSVINWWRTHKLEDTHG